MPTIYNLFIEKIKEICHIQISHFKKRVILASRLEELGMPEDSLNRFAVVGAVAEEARIPVDRLRDSQINSYKHLKGLVNYLKRHQLR